MFAAFVGVYTQQPPVGVVADAGPATATMAPPVARATTAVPAKKRFLNLNSFSPFGYEPAARGRLICEFARPVPAVRPSGCAVREPSFHTSDIVNDIF